MQNIKKSPVMRAVLKVFGKSAVLAEPHSED